MAGGRRKIGTVAERSGRLTPDTGSVKPAHRGSAPHSDAGARLELPRIPEQGSKSFDRAVLTPLPADVWP
jgi:hypothetical protein